MTEIRSLAADELTSINGGLGPLDVVVGIAIGVAANAIYDGLNNHEGTCGFTKGGIADYVLGQLFHGHCPA